MSAVRVKFANYLGLFENYLMESQAIKCETDEKVP